MKSLSQYINEAFKYKLRWSGNSAEVDMKSKLNPKDTKGIFKDVTSIMELFFDEFDLWGLDPEFESKTASGSSEFEITMMYGDDYVAVDGSFDYWMMQEPATYDYPSYSEAEISNIRVEKLCIYHDEDEYTEDIDDLTKDINKYFKGKTFGNRL